MKDYSEIKRYEAGIVYYNDQNLFHRLNGAAVEFDNGNKNYYINNIWYAAYLNKDNVLYIFNEVLQIDKEYHIFIKQNIKNCIIFYNAKIDFHDCFDNLNQLPDWLKDLIIL